MIRFSCTHCGSVLEVSDDKAGIQGKCPRCGALIVVPAATQDVGDRGRSPTSRASPTTRKTRAARFGPKKSFRTSSGQKSVIAATVTIAAIVFLFAPHRWPDKYPKEIDNIRVMDDSGSDLTGQPGRNTAFIPSPPLIYGGTSRICFDELGNPLRDVPMVLNKSRLLAEWGCVLVIGALFFFVGGWLSSRRQASRQAAASDPDESSTRNDPLVREPQP